MTRKELQTVVKGRSQLDEEGEEAASLPGVPARFLLFLVPEVEEEVGLALGFEFGSSAVKPVMEAWREKGSTPGTFISV